MASVHFQNLKRGREELWHGGAVLPQPKKINSNNNIGHDSDLMALLEKIDDITHNHSDGVLGGKKFEEEEEEEERLNLVMKSLQDEIDLKPCEDVNGGGGDDISNDGEITPSNGVPVDGNSETTTTSVSDVGDFYYDDIRAEFCFFADNTAEELGIMGSFEEEHSMADIYNADVFHPGYAENNTEVFYGSLWEDDIWQFNNNNNNNVNVNDHAAGSLIQNPSCSKEDGVCGEVAEFQDVGNDILRSIQCLSAREEKS